MGKWRGKDRGESGAGFPVPFQFWEICVALVALRTVVNVVPAHLAVLSISYLPFLPTPSTPGSKFVAYIEITFSL